MKYFFITALSLILVRTMHSQAPVVHYSLGLSEPWTHLFEVEITFGNLPGNDSTLELSLPVWRSGRYVLFDFASGIEQFEAFSPNDGLFDWNKIDKSTWRIKTRGPNAIVRYKVYANEFSSRTRGLNDEHGYVNGSSVFMYSEKYRNTGVTLKVTPYKDWKVTTGLERISDTTFLYRAPGYDDLIDCPLEIGTQTDLPFEIENKMHVLSIAGDVHWDTTTVIDGLRRIVQASKKFWGDLPYDRYYFLLHALPNASGATEHMNSTTIDVHPFSFGEPEGYTGFFSTAVHEFFHTWNVKRLRPKGMDPYSWQQENYYEELWIAEGGTSYYGGILLLRAGLKTPAEYITDLPKAVKDDRQRPGNLQQSLVECSFDAWTKFWKDNEQSFNSESNYYGKGANVCLLLDLEIRHQTKNKHSLDDVFRDLYKRFPLGSGGYTVDDFQRSAEAQGSGSLASFFDNYIRGVHPLPWEETFLYAGLELSPDGPTEKPFLGITASDRGNIPQITRVVKGSCAYDAGLNAGDELVALNGSKVRASDVNKRIKQMKAGDTVTVTVFRENLLRNFSFSLRNAPTYEYTVQKVKKPSSLQKSIYESWLSTEWTKE